MAKDGKKKLSLEDIGIFLEKLADKSENVYWLSSPDFKKIEYISPAYEKIWGRSRKELYKNPETWINFLHPDDALQKNPIHEMAEKIAIQGEEARFSEKYRIIRPDGTIRWILDNGFPIYDSNGNCCGVTGVAVDVTKEKEYETQLKKAIENAEAASKAKTAFLENMRHDIRTPLTGIVGFSEILKNESTEKKIKEYADNLIVSSHALLELLDEVLESIRVSSGEIPKLKRKFNLKKSLENIINLNLSKAAEKNLTLSLDFDSKIPLYFLGDKIRLHRIFLELVGNALNFTDYGFVKLTANFVQPKNNKVILRFCVEDSGVGIPKEKQQDIYLQFRRLTPSYQGIYKGAGLGLSVVKQFVDELEGEIYVESEQRKGTKFTIILPLQESLLDDDFGIDENADHQLEQQYQATYAQQIKKDEPSKNQHIQFNILVVEDNLIAQKVAKSMLESFECKVDIAESGEKALELWKEKSYDLIFMDIGLPDMDGNEVARKIRLEEASKNTHIPIIALTAHAGDENKKRCIDAGMNAVLTKPLTAKNCSDILNTFAVKSLNADVSNSGQYAKDLPQLEEEFFNLEPFPILDVEEGIKTTGDKAMLASMLRLLINESLTQDVEKMIAFHEQGDWEKVQQIAHKIKGGAVYVGTMKIKMACQYLERYWKVGGRDLLERLYEQAITTLKESTIEIQKWVNENS
ncbi:sensory histidine-kinase / response regulator (plasmid) [Legionella adelaidensis]|uniref:histidine kinase n=1 Tax=Legionella adelaidensis TaxID=45056 RepID=A0A0W0R3M9_9GAMM|nr:PAS domain-containing hybrid sensor histidine kinase/response regulator [Legionella adelaidensis]KTC65688.1 sensory histidine-kinase / response regulator [Legionella adelaidensis]VEH85970.1 sensory histidine-kinase / response regulator [Legionella adelaidensis]